MARLTATEKDSILAERLRRLGVKITNAQANTLRRAEKTLQRWGELGLSWFHQTDPRGCALFVSPQPLTDQNYSGVGVACCGEGE